jgi:hypothetical protein
LISCQGRSYSLSVLVSIVSRPSFDAGKESLKDCEWLRYLGLLLPHICLLSNGTLHLVDSPVRLVAYCTVSFGAVSKVPFRSGAAL